MLDFGDIDLIFKITRAKYNSLKKHWRTTSQSLTEQCLPCNTKIPTIDLIIPSCITERSYIFTYILTKLNQSNERCQNRSGGKCLHKNRTYEKTVSRNQGISLKKVGNPIQLSPFALSVCLFVYPPPLSKTLI